MKKILIIAVLVGATFVQAQAQRRGNQEVNPEQLAERMTERMAEKLNLTDQQKEQVHALHLEEAQKRKANLEARKETMESMKAEREAYREKIAAVLTPEQKEAWESLQAENRERMREGRRRQGPGSRDRQRSAPSDNQ
jgi:Spy/CpxP family protein refolding chaperone